MSTFQWHVGVWSLESPLGNERTLPGGIHIELLHTDENVYADLITPPIRQINVVRGEQAGKVGRQCSPEGLVQALGPSRVLKVFNFISAIAEGQGISQKVC